MKTTLKKLYEGNIPNVILLSSALKEAGIEPIIKDQATSATLAGFGSFNTNQEVFVFDDQFEKASEILTNLNLQ